MAKKKLEGTQSNVSLQDKFAPNISDALPQPKTQQPTVSSSSPTPAEISRKQAQAAPNEGINVATGATVPVQVGRPFGGTIVQGNEFQGVMDQQRNDQAKQVAQEQLAVAQQAANSVGVLTPEQNQLNIQRPEGLVSNIGTGASIAGGAIIGAKAGAATGTLVAPGVGTAIGAALGAAGGAAGGAYVKISGNKKQDVKNAVSVYTGSKQNMAWIMNQVNAGRISPQQAADLWDEELSNFYAAQRSIRELNKTNTARFLSGGAEEAAKIEAFARRLDAPAGLNDQFRQALIAPNPLAPAVNFDDPTDNQNG